MSNTNFIEVDSEETWLEYYNSDKCLVIDFTASWCGPCKMIAPVFKLLSEKFPQIYFLKVDVDEFEDIAMERSINCMPTFQFVKDKNILSTIKGVNMEKLVGLTQHFDNEYNAKENKSKEENEDKNEENRDKNDE